LEAPPEGEHTGVEDDGVVFSALHYYDILAVGFCCCRTPYPCTLPREKEIAKETLKYCVLSIALGSSKGREGELADGMADVAPSLRLEEGCLLVPRSTTACGIEA
jgi:hypothetical protein